MHSNEKLRIAFDPSKEMWNQEFFRDFMRKIQRDTEGTILYLVTLSTDIGFIERVRQYIGIDEDKVIHASDPDEVISAMEDNKILIHLTDDEELNALVNETVPLVLKKDKAVTGTQALGVYNALIDPNKIQPNWVTSLTFWTDQIKRYS